MEQALPMSDRINTVTNALASTQLDETLRIIEHLSKKTLHLVLPEELILNIYGYLSDILDVKSASLVSRSFRHCAFHSLWLSIRLETSSKSFADPYHIFKSDNIGHIVRRLDLNEGPATQIYDPFTTEDTPLAVLVGHVFPNVEHLLVDLPRFNLLQLSRNKINRLTVRLHMDASIALDWIAREKNSHLEVIHDPIVESARPIDIHIEDGDLEKQIGFKLLPWQVFSTAIKDRDMLSLRSLNMLACDKAKLFVLGLRIPIKMLRYNFFVSTEHEQNHRESYPNRIFSQEDWLNRAALQELAILGSRSHHEHRHTCYMYHSPSQWHFVQYINLQRLTLFDAAILDHFVLMPFLPPHLKALQIHCWDLVKHNFKTDKVEMDARELYTLITTPSTVPASLRQVVLWVEDLKHMQYTEGSEYHSDEEVKDMLQDKFSVSAGHFANVSVSFEICYAPTFEDTPLAWEGCNL